MTNKEKLNIIYERMGGYTNPRKDDKTGWILIIRYMRKYIDNLVPALLISLLIILTVMWVLLTPSDENNDCYLMLIPSGKVNIPICIPNE